MERLTAAARRIAPLFAFALAFAFALPAMAAHRYELQIKGLSKSKATGYAFTNTAPGGAGATRRRGDTKLSAIQVTKGIDKTTPKLLEANASGRLFKNATLKVFDGNTLIFVITMKNVMVSDTAHSGGRSKAEESFGLNFEEIVWKFVGAGGPIKASWKRE